MTTIYETLAQRSGADWQQCLMNFDYRITNFIDGEHCQSLSGATFEVVSPAIGNVHAAASRSGEADIEVAVNAASRAFKSACWSRLAPRDRMAVLYRFADLIAAHAESFAMLDVLDMGKPITDMLEVDVP